MPNADKTLLSLIHTRVIQRLAVAGVFVGAITACSPDTMRFGDNPFANPFGETQANNQSAASNVGYSSSMSVQSAPLAPPQQAASLPLSTPVALVPESSKGWTAQGGSYVYVGTADTLATLSGRYNVPSVAILSANGLTSPAQITAGQRLVIPVYNPTASAAPVAVASAPVSQSTAPAPQLAPLPVAVPRSIQQAKKETGSLNEQAARTSQVSVAPQQVQAPVSKQAVASASSQVTVAPAAPKSEEPAATVASGEEKAGFRWPARGRVISGFGSGNEGINIAVPEGTPVKAAESGVVAYAGNELKGYGNLILVRHENGWVSAYANNGELKVKRGDTVSRGQTIAKSGQTGNVTSPQLHFELRKGSKPVDPLPHLAGL